MARVLVAMDECSNTCHLQCILYINELVQSSSDSNKTGDINRRGYQLLASDYLCRPLCFTEKMIDLSN